MKCLNITPYSKILSSLALAFMASGCSATGSGTTSSNTEYIRTTQGQTLAKIRDGNVYLPNGVRTHRIDSAGNIYSVQGPTAGQRVGKITK